MRLYKKPQFKRVKPATRITDEYKPYTFPQRGHNLKGVNYVLWFIKENHLTCGTWEFRSLA